MRHLLLIRHTEEEFVLLIKGRGATAFSALYDEYAGALYGVIIRAVPHEQAAQLTLQNTFIQIFKQIDEYDKSALRLFTWMIRIAICQSGLANAQHKKSNLHANQSFHTNY